MAGQTGHSHLSEGHHAAMSKSPDTYQCATCGKVRAGRFTRRRSGAAGSWTPGDSQRRSIPYWFCYTCLPLGEGRDEEAQVPIKSEKVSHIQPSQAPQALSATIEREHRQGLALANPLIQELGRLHVTTAEEYLVADQLLGKVRNARKQWGTIWQQFYTRVVQPQKAALDNMYAINREIEKPLEDGEKKLKTAMADYKTEERRLLEEANRKRDEEANRTEQLIAETQAKLATAKGSVKRVLNNNLERLENRQQAIMEDVPLPVLASNSSERTIKVLKVNNLLRLAQFLASDEIDPQDLAAQAVLEAVELAIQRAGRTQAEKERLSQWPGVSLVDQAQIVGR